MDNHHIIMRSILQTASRAFVIILLTTMVTTGQAKVAVEKIEYKGWKNCYHVSNGIVDMVVTTDVGPRIIRFGFVGQENEFKEFEDMIGKTGGSEWRIYGGHRLWHAPEIMPRTYFPDNGPVTLEQQGEIVRLIQPVEPTTGIQKEIDIRLSPNEARVELVHRLRNTNVWAVELAPWALTAMAPGGEAIIPLPPRGPHPKYLLPTNTLTLWAFTDLSDHRWTWGRKYIFLHQDSEAKEPQKIGVMDTDGWIAYARANHLFVKKFQYLKDARYPDMGCTAETFTNKDMLELETLGPVVNIEPGAAVEHVEQWFLFSGVSTPKNDAEVDKDVLPKVREASATSRK